MIKILFMILFMTTLAFANESEELLASCLKGMPGVKKEDCQCLVKQIKTNKKIVGLFKATKKKHGPKFRQEIIADLKDQWWTGPKYKHMPKSRKLNDKQASILAISLNASIACLNK